MKPWIAIILLLSSGCAFEHKKDQDGKGSSIRGLLDRPVSYAEVYSAVIGPRCVSCHGTAGGNQGKLNLETYESTFPVASSIENAAITSKTMPKDGSLSDGEIQLLATWLAQGATRNGSMQRGSSKLRERVVWGTIKEEILDKKCLDCHSPPRPEKDLDLSTLEAVKANITKIFNRAVVVQDMPMQPVEHLSVEEKQALAQWIALGMPE